MTKVIGVIPARMGSGRFPGKPLFKIAGMPMMEHVWHRAKMYGKWDELIVATCDSEIKDFADSKNIPCVMTSNKHERALDRVAEAIENSNFQVDSNDIVLNVQGDEPMTDPENVSLVYNTMAQDLKNVINCFCEISHSEILMASVPKVVISETNSLIYMSRGGVPFDKNSSPCAQFKQVCIYGYSREHLRLFSAQKNKTRNEVFEDIEILRFLEMSYDVRMIALSGSSFAIDTPEDLEKVREQLKKDKTP